MKNSNSIYDNNNDNSVSVNPTGIYLLKVTAETLEQGVKYVKCYQ